MNKLAKLLALDKKDAKSSDEGQSEIIDVHGEKVLVKNGKASHKGQSFTTHKVSLVKDSKGNRIGHIENGRYVHHG